MHLKTVIEQGSKRQFATNLRQAATLLDSLNRYFKKNKEAGEYVIPLMHGALQRY